MDAPATETLAPLAAAVTVPPAQVVAPTGVPVLTRPAGYVSVNAAPVIAMALVLPSVSVRTDGAPGATDVGANAFASVGWARTVSVAVAAGAVPAFVVVTAPVELR